MDKTPIEILKSSENNPETRSVVTCYQIYHEDVCLRAIKTAMKQVWDAAKLRHWATDADTFTDFEEYFNTLEETK